MKPSETKKGQKIKDIRDIEIQWEIYKDLIPKGRESEEHATSDGTIITIAWVPSRVNEKSHNNTNFYESSEKQSQRENL
jgi:hypothetical protein